MGEVLEFKRPDREPEEKKPQIRPLADSPVFQEIMRANAEKKKALADERLKGNKKVLKSYRIKG